MNDLIAKQLAAARATCDVGDLVVLAGVGSYMKRAGRPQPLLPGVVDEAEMIAFCRHFEYDVEALWREGRTGRFAAQSPSFGRVRVEAGSAIRGATLRFRLLPDAPWAIDDVGLPDAIIQILSAAQRGLVVITGVMDSGKSVILDAAVSGLYVPQGRDVILFQDPVETMHSSHLVTQYNVGTSPMNLRDWDESHEHLVRSGALVIGIYEVNSKATARAALRAAESGALVFVTLHSSFTSRAIGRLLSYFDAAEQALVRTQTADSLVGVLGPRLIPRKEQRPDEPARVLACEWLPNDPEVRLHIQMGDTKALEDYLMNPPTDGKRPVLLEDELNRLVDAGEIDARAAADAANRSAKLRSVGAYA